VGEVVIREHHENITNTTNNINLPSIVSDPGENTGAVGE
jgi:hypothetical protein